MKEKLLLLGVDTSTKYALEYANSLENVKTIVTDYHSSRNKEIKQMADESWQIDLKDIDFLEQRCREEGITGIYAGNSEFCLDQAKKLTQRLGLPFYASDEAWACSRDKLRFKKHCIECGLDVPRLYQLQKPFSPEILESIQYPVIVKPTDSCAQQGLSICYDQKELFRAYDKALEKSNCKRVVVEEYVNGKECAFAYIVVNGVPYFESITDQFPILYGGRNFFIFDNLRKCHQNDHAGKMAEQAKSVLNHMNVWNGSALLQAIQKDEKFYFLEFAHRLDGVFSWVPIKQIQGTNKLEVMVDFALGKNVLQRVKVLTQGNIKESVAVYFPLCNPGKIRKIVGLDEIKTMDGIEVNFERFHKGDEVQKTDSMLQLAYFISIIADDLKQMAEKVRKINETLHIYDENGKEMIRYFDDYDTIINAL